MSIKGENGTPFIIFLCSDPRIHWLNEEIMAVQGFVVGRDIEVRVCGGAYLWDILRHSLQTAKKVFGADCRFRIVLTVHSDCQGAPHLPDDAIEETYRAARTVCPANPIDFIAINTVSQTYEPVRLPHEEQGSSPVPEAPAPFWKGFADQWVPGVVG